MVIKLKWILQMTHMVEVPMKLRFFFKLITSIIPEDPCMEYLPTLGSF
jgi:hypothetical protein